MESDELLGEDMAVEGERQIDDRELQTLTSPYGHHLNRLCLAVQAPAALLGAHPFVTLRSQPVTQCGQAEVLTLSDLVQQFGDVCEIGHVTFAAGPGEYVPAHPVQLRRLVDRRNAGFAGVVGPLAQRVSHIIGQGVTAAGEFIGGLPKEHGCRGCPDQAGAVRLIHRVEHTQPVVGSGGFQHIAVTGVDGRHPCGEQTLEALARAGVTSDHRDVAGLQLPPVERRPAGEQCANVGGHILDDVRPEDLFLHVVDAT